MVCIQCMLSCSHTVSSHPCRRGVDPVTSQIFNYSHPKPRRVTVTRRNIGVKDIKSMGEILTGRRCRSQVGPFVVHRGTARVSYHLSFISWNLLSHVASVSLYSFSQILQTLRCIPWQHQAAHILCFPVPSVSTTHWHVQLPPPILAPVAGGVAFPPDACPADAAGEKRFHAKHTVMIDILQTNITFNHSSFRDASIIPHEYATAEHTRCDGSVALVATFQEAAADLLVKLKKAMSISTLAARCQNGSQVSVKVEGENICFHVSTCSAGVVTFYCGV